MCVIPSWVSCREVFFFQAEDGIRDLTVTGVQTCALPILWVNHHELMRLVRVVTYPLLFANGLLLLTVTFVPFPTAVLAQHLATPEAKVAVAFYCGTFVVNSLGWGLVFATMVRGRLFRAGVDAGTIRRVRRAYLVGPLVYVVATLVALRPPLLGLALNACLWLLWIRLGYRETAEGRRRL